MTSPSFSTAIESHGEVDASIKEIYGVEATIVRLGNGGAGATGLLRALSEDYLNTLSHPASIAWICNHSRNTQLALLQDYVDIALTYERDQESLAASEGWSKTIGCVFHDHFCLAGPASDPADIRSSPSMHDALSRIAKTESPFHSRADTSATMWKERGLWLKCGIAPWKQRTTDVFPSLSSSPATEITSTTNGWYHTTLYTPSEALIAADRAGAYLLTDRSTLLRQTALHTIHNTTVFFEPTTPDDVLMNSCYALTSPRHRDSKEQTREMGKFLEYMFSERGQAVIAAFGKDSLGGFSLFAPVRDGFARSFLKGGIPRQGKWVIIES